MTIYLCLDDRNGMLFNGRRQSRDIRVLEDIQSSLPGALTIEPFSEKLIQSAGIPFRVAPPEPGDHLFLESPPAPELLPLATRVVIYRWNRHYPADVRWEADLSQYGFTLTQTTDFPGKSHDNITKEVYTR